MPEGLEVYILGKALGDVGIVCQAIGKHLIIKHPYTGEWHDYTFGLAGKIKIHEKTLEIKKVNHSRIVSGDVQKVNHIDDVKSKLGIDWLSATRSEFEVVVRSWLSRKKQIGSLLIDQKEICGIGVTWASEILHMAKINPGLKTNLLQFLDLIKGLLDAIISVREKYLKIYLQCITKDRRKFINSWFGNLYEERKKYLQVYGKGQVQKISGREFFVQINHDNITHGFDENKLPSPT